MNTNTPPASPKPGDSYVQSFARGLEVIRSFSATAPQQTLSEVAAQTGLTRAGARRILLTLQTLGYVESDGRLFRLTPRILDLGFAYLSSMPIWDLAEPVMEELVEMAKKFREAAKRGEALGLSEDEVKFYDALANNAAAALELGDEILRKIAHELTDNLRKNLSVDWSARESVRAKLRLMVKRILRKYKYPPDGQEEAVQTVLQQAEALGVEWG